MNADPEAAQVQKAIALKDILHFFKYHACTHEPRPAFLKMYGLTQPAIPFLLFDYQEDMILKLQEHINQGIDLLVEKSRDMGVSWLVITVMLHYFLQPVPGNDFLLGSRKFEYVDRKGAEDTLFEKARYIFYRLHSVFRPEGFDRNRHDNVGLIQNPETGSFIRGEANNANFGSGGRYKAALMDEFAKWEETDEQAWTSMGDSAPCRIPVSTPWGLGRKFAQLRFSGAIEVLTLHWSLHPLKSAGLYKDQDGKQRSPWYDAECERRKDDPEANIGQELDIDYLTTGHPYFDNKGVSDRCSELMANPEKVERFDLLHEGEDVKFVPHPRGALFIRRQPAEPRGLWSFRYLISADVAEGLEVSDNSAVYVYDRLLGEDVAWYAGRIDTDLFADLLFKLSKFYHNAYIAPENNNHGHAVIQRLKRLTSRIMNERDFSQGVDLDRDKLGWNTNVQTRPIMCSDLREALRKRVDGIHDVEFFREALTFVLNERGKPCAVEGKLDDRVIAQAIKFQLHAWLPSPKKAEAVERIDAYDYDDEFERVPRPVGADAV